MNLLNIIFKWLGFSSHKKENTQNTAKEKGDKFEQLIVNKFDKRYFILKEWRSDKGTNGRYAESNKNPDLEFEFRLKNIKYTLAVECKWRQNYYKGGINWAKKTQMERYHNYATDKKVPVFIIIEIGGNSDNPNEIFVIPLKALKFNFITANYLKKFKKNDITKNFYFNAEKEVLK